MKNYPACIELIALVPYILRPYWNKDLVPSADNPRRPTSHITKIPVKNQTRHRLRYNRWSPGYLTHPLAQGSDCGVAMGETLDL